MTKNQQQNYPDEIWKDIPEYEDFYQVSTKGRVRSLNTPHKVWYGSYIKKGRILKADISRSGYKRVTFSKYGITKRFCVHKLVLLTFVPNPENKPQGNHLDGNKLNNCLENLEWCTESENATHAQKTGLTVASKGEKCGRSKLSEKVVKAIRKSYKPGVVKQQDLADRYGVVNATISLIINRKIWRHI